ncbi:PopZ family protein [Ensifer sp.]|uniref:PopZ family protein n=1 Tax=Ensifer sp. TaxID=1872086 RepID=UPI000DDB5C42|nr:PopZ family protein [Ensifer sp.]
MAQLNVAREPSMDEILASIRKIIESNEPGQVDFSAHDHYDNDSSDEIELTIDSEIEAAAFGRRDEAVEAPKPATPSPEIEVAVIPSEPPANMAQPPLSLADVAARVRAASERHTMTYSAKDVVSDAPVRSVQDSPVITSRMAAVSAPPAPADRLAVGLVQAPVNHGVATEVERVNASEPVSVAVSVGAVAVIAEEPVAEKAAPAIVSPEVGRQVAQSFDSLAQAVDLSTRRSFDEIAEEMLRPMLQEWLDDNLPTLVERLVREEIERVARGPRR